MKKTFLSFSLILFSFLSFGQQTVGLFQNDTLSYNGYTLFAPGGTNTTYLIDNCGDVVNLWDGATATPGASVYLLENGNLLRTGRIASNFNGGGSGGRLELFNWEGDLVWNADYSSTDYHLHHDVAVMPNGNILAIAWEVRSNAEVIDAGRIPDNTLGDVWSERIVELKPIGTDDYEVVWTWKLWDHLIQDYDATKINFGVVADHPELWDINFGINPLGNNMDWIHFNSINYNAELDQILLSSRHLNEIYIIDHSTSTLEAAGHSGGNSGKGGDILFRWGNAQAYDRGFPDQQKLFGQHDARWIPNGLQDGGKIMVFNNGLNRPGGSYSTIDVIEPPMDNNNMYTLLPNEPFGPTSLSWIYEADNVLDLYSANISGAHRLPNGNTLICEGRKGNFFEVTYDGDIVWHYVMPVSNTGPVPQGSTITSSNIFRATRYGVDYLAFIGKDLTPGDPVEINPLPSNCEIDEEPVAISNLQQIEGVRVLNNPLQDFLFIKNEKNQELIIEIFDIVGKNVWSGSSADVDIQIDATAWNNGFYVVRFLDKKSKYFFSEKIIKH